MIMDYQLGGSILPDSSLFIGLVLLLMLSLAVVAGIFFAEGNLGMCLAFVVAVATLAYGLRYVSRRKVA
jgi:hypothetical protein